MNRLLPRSMRPKLRGWLLQDATAAKWRGYRRSSLYSSVPGLLDGPPSRVLYVGVGSTAQPSFLNDFFLAGCPDITILEAFEPHIVNLKHVFGHPPYHMILGDVREVDQNNPGGVFDVTFWWHGPEHVPQDDLEPTLKRLEAITTGIVVLGMPWGRQESAKGENIYAIHKNAIYPEQLQSLGYDTHTLYRPNARGSHITAWKYCVL